MKLRRYAGLASFAAILLLGGMTFAAEQPAASADKYVWDLTDLYPSPDAWTAEYNKIKAEAEKLDQYKGTLGRSADSMFKALDAISDAYKESARLSTYAGLKADEDLTNAPNQERRQLAQSLQTLVNEKSAWVAPEVLAIGEAKVKSFIGRNAELAKRFDFFLLDTLRNKPHTLGPEAEGVMAAAGNVIQQPDNIRGQLAHSDLPFPTITLADGTKAKLTDAAYSKYRQVDNRADRKKVFDAFWGAYQKYKNTFGATLTTQIMAVNFNAKVRHYPNSLAAALFSDDMPEAVYRTLVKEANAGLPVLHRYLRLRKELLGIKGDLGYEDMYPTMFRLKKPLKFTIEDSERITLEALEPYGEEYLGMLRKAFAGRWLHAFPAEHKASGAYMNGSAYDVHPYMLLNHNDDYDSLSTFAHEWGHAVHTLLTNGVQPFEKADYSTFTAETASIGNEMLLMDYMVKNAKTKDDKLYYLGEGLEGIRTTFFRQTMFAEFQLAMHEEMEAGRPLSGERMTAMYCDLLRKYYGEDKGVTKINPTYCAEWAFIPHFFYGYYVWQYATSMAGAAQLTDDILKEGTPARDRFIDLLKAGGSDYPYNLYKQAGIDMATPEPYQKLVSRMTSILDQIDELRKQK
ncbi:MAG: oligoendopeptidase F [Alphaproteobacteria bacterium]